MSTNYTDNRVANAATVTIPDSHSEGKTISCDSVWTFTDSSNLITIGFDAGDCHHCINHIDQDDHGHAFLSMMSFGGNYYPHGELANWDVEHEGTTVTRDSISSYEDLLEKLDNAKSHNLKILRAAKAA